MPNSEGAIYTLPRLWRKNKVIRVFRHLAGQMLGGLALNILSFHLYFLLT
jgi:hypothetical protein